MRTQLTLAYTELLQSALTGLQGVAVLSALSQTKDASIKASMTMWWTDRQVRTIVQGAPANECCMKTTHTAVVAAVHPSLKLGWSDQLANDKNMSRCACLSQVAPRAWHDAGDAVVADLEKPQLQYTHKVSLRRCGNSSCPTEPLIQLQALTPPPMHRLRYRCPLAR